MDHFGYNRSQLHKNLVRDAYSKVSLLWVSSSIIFWQRRRSRRQSNNFLIPNPNKNFWWLLLIIMFVVWSRIKRSNHNSYKCMESFLNAKNSLNDQKEAGFIESNECIWVIIIEGSRKRVGDQFIENKIKIFIDCWIFIFLVL